MSDWRDSAACLGQDSSLFFHEENERDSEGRRARDTLAKKICGTCPAQPQCLQWAIEHHEIGIWGGLTEGQRRRQPKPLTTEPLTPQRRVPQTECTDCGLPMLPGRRSPRPVKPEPGVVFHMAHGRCERCYSIHRTNHPTRPRGVDEVRVQYVLDGGVMRLAPAERPAVVRELTARCGSMFGLPIRRHRAFETNWPAFTLMQPCQHHRDDLPFMHKGERAFADAMGCTWMTNRGGRQAIPPAYATFIGEQLITHLSSVGSSEQETTT